MVIDDVCMFITKLIMKLIVNEFVKIQKQLKSTTITDQKNLNAVKGTSGCQITGYTVLTYQFPYIDLESQLKEVKTDIASSIKKQDATDNKVENLSGVVESVRSDLTTQGEVVKQLHSEVGNLVTAHREQTEMILEQQRQMRESL